MIPLSLVTGFLGSGKTTLLRHVIARDRDRRLAFVVNEFGPVDVDGRLLDLPEDRVLSIPGGSIFCRCLSGELVGSLRRIAEWTDESGERLDGVVIEASGIADPRVAGPLLLETGLSEQFELRTIVAIVDPTTFPKLLHTLPNVVAQVEACSLAIVNKIDLHPEAEIRAVEAQVAAINPRAIVLRAEHARLDLDILAPSPVRELAGELAPCADPRYARSVVEVRDPIDPDELLAELRALGDAVWRAKGFVPSADGFVHLDYSVAGMTCRPAPCPPDGGRLVVIARGDVGADARMRIARLGQCSSQS